MAPRLVADSDDLERLAIGDDDGIAALHGWRAEVFGNDAMALRDGRLAIALEHGEAVVIEPARSAAHAHGAPRLEQLADVECGCARAMTKKIAAAMRRIQFSGNLARRDFAQIDRRNIGDHHAQRGSDA